MTKLFKGNIDFMLNLACVITDGTEYNSLADFVTMSKRGANRESLGGDRKMEGVQ